MNHLPHIDVHLKGAPVDIHTHCTHFAYMLRTEIDKSVMINKLLEESFPIVVWQIDFSWIRVSVYGVRECIFLFFTSYIVCVCAVLFCYYVSFKANYESMHWISLIHPYRGHHIINSQCTESIVIINAPATSPMATFLLVLLMPSLQSEKWLLPFLSSSMRNRKCDFFRLLSPELHNDKPMRWIHSILSVINISSICLTIKTIVYSFGWTAEWTKIGTVSIMLETCQTPSHSMTSFFFIPPARGAHMPRRPRSISCKQRVKNSHQITLCLCVSIHLNWRHLRHMQNTCIVALLTIPYVMSLFPYSLARNRISLSLLSLFPVFLRLLFEIVKNYHFSHENWFLIFALSPSLTTLYLLPYPVCSVY